MKSEKDEMENTDKRFRPVIILSPGRSGSTLLQRYLNASNDLIVWGEHGGFLTGLSIAYNKIFSNENVQKLLLQGVNHAEKLLNSEVPVNMDIEWTNNFTREDFRQAYRNLVMSMLTINVPHSMEWGFKEIRYKDNEILFLKEIFPQAQFIYVVRHPIDTLASMIAAWDKKIEIWEKKSWLHDESVHQFVLDLIERFTNHILKVAEAIKRFNIDNGDGFLVKFENLRDNPASVVNALCSSLEIGPPSPEKIIMIANDVRRAMNTKCIKESLYDDFSYDENVQKLISLYRFFGYTDSPAHNG